MLSIKAASRYAKSLIELAKERGELDRIAEDMAFFARTVEEHYKLEVMLKNPIITHDKKLRVLEAIFGSRVSELSMAMFKIVVRKHREPILQSIAEEFVNQYSRYKGIEHAQVITAVPISDELRSKFKEIVKKESGREPRLSEKIDESLIGGYILNIGDRQIDASVKSKLRELKKQFAAPSTSKI
jgi:F-type H+-transporting ATPase subunit delta